MRNDKLEMRGKRRTKMGAHHVSNRLRLLTAALLIFKFSFFICSCSNPFLPVKPGSSGDSTLDIIALGIIFSDTGGTDTGGSDIDISLDLGPSSYVIGSIINTAVQQGENVVISTNGTFDAYAWRLNGETIPDENSSTLTLPLAQCVGKTVYITANVKLGAYWYNQNMSLTITRN